MHPNVIAPRKFMWLDIAIPMILLTIATFLFRHFQWDMEIARHFYAPDRGWFLGNHQPWRLLYNFGTLPAIILVMGAVLLMGRSFQRVAWQKYRKIALFFILVMLAGPGLLVNVVLKDHWGRPRPRSMVEFGGNYKYEKVLSIDRESHGKSFPSGHASMGFYLFTPFFILRRRYPIQSVLILLAGLGMGFLLGFARIAQGGHFASDVFWSAGLVYLVSAIIFYSMRMDQCLYYKPEEAMVIKNLFWIRFIIILSMIVILGGVFLATPYTREKSFTGRSEYLSPSRKTVVQMIVPEADMIIRTGDWYTIRLDANGFGLPWSKLKNQLWETKDEIAYNANYVQRSTGYFSELSQEMNVTYPVNIPGEFKVLLGKGDVILHLDPMLATQNWTVYMEKGNLTMDLLPGQQVHLKAEVEGKKFEKDLMVSPKVEGLQSGSNAPMQLHVIILKGKLNLPV